MLRASGLGPGRAGRPALYAALLAAGAACGGNVASDTSGDASGGAGGRGGALVAGEGGESGAVSVGGTGAARDSGVGGAVAVGGAGPGGAGPGGAGGSPTPDGAAMGRACRVTAECGGLTCIGGDGSADRAWPARGWCSLDCTDDPGVCAGLRADAACIPLDPAALDRRAMCVEGCQYGPENLQSFEPAKCGGRSEAACSPNPVGGGPVCLPQCNADGECDGGVCNPRTGLCQREPVAGARVGASCDTSTSDACRGECIDYPLTDASTAGVCFERCTTGALPACGWDGPGTGDADAFCVYAYSEVVDGGGPGVGDLGACGQLCNCDDECRSPAFRCVAHDSAQFEQATGKAGICSDPAIGRAIPCRDGG